MSKWSCFRKQDYYFLDNFRNQDQKMLKCFHAKTLKQLDYDVLQKLVRLLTTVLDKGLDNVNLIVVRAFET
jgi:hypothetical protein